uniref:Immunoglobulin V-set domain-containing protein n=1 Tax=Chrysemys picta bellii TaxID=8478 RepID=A0A8C3IF12_CHRPI
MNLTSNLPFFISPPGAHSQVLLTQSGTAVKKAGESHRLQRAGSGVSSMGNMFWIRQTPGKGLEGLIYYYSPSDNSYSPAIQGRFTASKDSSNFYLHMDSLKPEDTAVYYCARDTARGNLLRVIQEPAAGRSMNALSGRGQQLHREQREDLTGSFHAVSYNDGNWDQSEKVFPSTGIFRLANVYKPPSISWNQQVLPSLLHPSV